MPGTPALMLRLIARFCGFPIPGMIVHGPAGLFYGNNRIIMPLFLLNRSASVQYVLPRPDIGPTKFDLILKNH
jgi:hypothetical protein